MLPACAKSMLRPQIHRETAAHPIVRAQSRSLTVQTLKLQRRGKKEREKKERKAQEAVDVSKTKLERELAEGLVFDVGGELIPTDEK